MHSCGCITHFLPELIDIGLDYLEPVQPCMDLPLIKKKYGKYLTFQGGIDTQTAAALRHAGVRCARGRRR